MAFINTRLSDEVSYGFQGGPEWFTLIVPFSNGGEARDAKWAYPKHKYSGSYNDILKEHRDAILNAFHACRGRLHAFRFKDWNDFEATNQPFPVVAGTRTPAQLTKDYTFGSESTRRRIQAPVTAQVFRSGVGAVSGQLDTSTGLFTPDTNWAAGATYFWTGTFDVWVRFDNDYNPFTIGSWQTHTAQIDLIEVRR